MKKVAILGATGSIGRQAIDVIERLQDRFTISLISANSDKEGLIRLAERYKVPNVCFSGERAFDASELTYPCRVFQGTFALEQAAKESDYDILLNAVVGLGALKPTMIALEKGARIALANKEMLVSAGEYVMKRASSLQGEIIPVDSEHSAIFQCLKSGAHEEVDRLIVTSSGGAFRDVPLDELDGISPDRALLHPNWKMGKKITIDCATMVNKGFEVIEAQHLFNIPLDKIEAVIHRESIVHSMVRFADGSTIAQLSDPDMRLPIQYALTYPQRLPSPVKSPDVPFSLTFSAVEEKRYPCFSIMREAAKRGGLYPAAMLAADTVLVPAYLQKKIRYSDIPRIMEIVLSKFALSGTYSLEDVLNINAEVEKYTHKVVEK